MTVHEGRWQEVVPKLLEQCTIFDAIYFDTFAEAYKDFSTFFGESVVGLLDDKGKWSFFNGMNMPSQCS